jgi:glycosyltransferase involved in cell wall biosynthesis
LNSDRKHSESDALITIGITCYSEGDWLVECWESVLAQTDDRWEAVLVMDGTTHLRTRQIFEQLHHPKLLKFAMLTNAGPYPTRNMAFELTKTPYHFYLDGDDQLMPDSVALVLKTFECHPDAAFVYGDYECFGARSEIWRSPMVVRPEDLVENQPTPGGCAYKKHVWEQLGGFAAELARGNADYDFCIGASEAGFRSYHCGLAFYRHRIGHASKVSDSYKCRYHQTHEIMVRRHPRFFSDTARRKRFLGLGYRKASLANRAAGNSKEAARLAWQAFRHGFSRDHELRNALREGYLPSWINCGLLRLWRLQKRLRLKAQAHL